MDIRKTKQNELMYYRRNGYTAYFVGANIIVKKLNNNNNNKSTVDMERKVQGNETEGKNKGNGPNNKGSQDKKIEGTAPNNNELIIRKCLFHCDVLFYYILQLLWLFKAYFHSII